MEEELMLCAAHYDALILENNDPVRDPPPLQAYMAQWDGAAFLALLQLTGRESVLEIGVGTGRLAQKTAPLCNLFAGIDLSAQTIARAKENLRAFNRVQLICGDFLTFSFATRFDVIYSSLCFMHIQDKQKAIQKVAALLNNGGRLVLSIDKNPASVLDMGTRQLRIYPDSPQQIRQLLNQAELKLYAAEETTLAYLFAAQKQPTSEQ